MAFHCQQNKIQTLHHGMNILSGSEAYPPVQMEGQPFPCPFTFAHIFILPSIFPLKHTYAKSHLPFGTCYSTCFSYNDEMDPLKRSTSSLSLATLPLMHSSIIVHVSQCKKSLRTAFLQIESLENIS